MALAKKGTRVAMVDGRRYRWVVAPDDEPGLAIVVEDADAGGQRMVTWVEHGMVITPGACSQGNPPSPVLGLGTSAARPQFITCLP